MISFQQFDLYSKNNNSSCDSGLADSVSLFKLTDAGTILGWKKCGLQSIVPEPHGLQDDFTILSKQLKPQTLGPGKFNCSVPHYEQFKVHLHCNLITECQNGEDEQFCPYNKGHCNGSIAFGDKCYQYFDRSGAITWMDAYRHCQQRNASLASLNTPKEWDAIETALDFGHRASVVFIGLRTADPNLPAFYRRFWQWADDTIAYFVHLKGEQVFPSCAALPWGWDNYSITFPCNESTNADFLCEYHSPRVGQAKLASAVKFPELPANMEIFEAKNISVVQCPAGHVTLDYLSCDPASFCGEERYCRCARLN
ncbi:hypothetical protein C0Q70_05816 [Pomacea canaliculata]|uniref:C-type lectin domain-containing protein n=1 Tax=Pomacea canaliculata TaxID=400727 RepID=A0A2T7PM94_POMCA|nr:hypothetical protein C0Q70_05816 [Pomacea canaliculata]